MYSKLLRRFTLSALSSLFVGFTAFSFASQFQTKFKFNQWSMITKVECLETMRVNKPEIIKELNGSKEELLLLIYNRQSEQELKQQIVKFEDQAEKLGIKKVLLIDQTDIRHLETFTRILREDIDEEDKKESKQPVSLDGKMRVMYTNPAFDGNKPFVIQSLETLAQQVKEIRGHLKINPSEEELKRSLEKFNHTTVVKNCYNQTCVEEYKQKIRQLIDLQLLRQKSQNYTFYVTNSKNDASRVAGIIGQTSNKQEIYVFKNDILGKSRQLYTEFLEKEGANYQNNNKFMMMIRPRVHILSRRSMNTDLFWFVSTLRSNSVPAFSINNTMSNFPLKVILSQSSSEGQEKERVLWLKGHPEEVELIKKLKEQYGNGIEVLIMETNLPSELLRHAYQPQRYCVFTLSPHVPYPKLLMKPPTLTVNEKDWFKMVKVEPDNADQFKIKGLDSEKGAKDGQKWARVLQKVNKFMTKPFNYSSIKIFSEKEMEINAERLKELLANTKLNKAEDKWIFRICGPINNCLQSAYEKYGYGVSTRVYKLDAQVQNVDIQEGDYEVTGDFIQRLSK